MENTLYLILGDFNLVLDPKLDRANSKIYHPQAPQTLLEFAEHLELVDPWRIGNPQTKRYSWHRAQGAQHGASRIDFALVDKAELWLSQ